MINNIRTDSKNDELVVSRRGQIARHAARLMMKTGYHGTTLRQIARASNMGLGTIYHYIGTKEDILRLIVDVPENRLSALGEQIKSNIGTIESAALLKKAIAGYYRLVDELEDVWLFNFTESKHLPKDSLKSVMEAYTYFIDIFDAIIIQGCKTKEFKTDSSRLIAQNIITLGIIWATSRWFLRSEYTISEYIQKQTKLILQLLVADTSPKAGPGKK